MLRTCAHCRLAYPPHVAADNIDWFCHRLILRQWALPRWRWRLALALHRAVCLLIRLPGEGISDVERRLLAGGSSGGT